MSTRFYPNYCTDIKSPCTNHTEIQMIQKYFTMYMLLPSSLEPGLMLLENPVLGENIFLVYMYIGRRGYFFPFKGDTAL